MIKEVAFVAVAVTDIDRARKFYEGAVGLKQASASAGVRWVE
jgi:extradiol dioxygenase family protein